MFASHKQVFNPPFGKAILFSCGFCGVLSRVKSEKLFVWVHGVLHVLVLFLFFLLTYKNKILWAEFQGKGKGEEEVWYSKWQSLQSNVLLSEHLIEIHKQRLLVRLCGKWTDSMETNWLSQGHWPRTGQTQGRSLNSQSWGHLLQPASCSPRILSTTLTNQLVYND